MSGFVIDADGHIMEDHKDIFAHIKGNFSEMNWHSTWPLLFPMPAGCPPMMSVWLRTPKPPS